MVVSTKFRKFNTLSLLFTKIVLLPYLGLFSSLLKLYTLLFDLMPGRIKRLPTAEIFISIISLY